MKEGVVAAAPPLSVPIVWSFLGNHFPAGSMIVGLLACLMIRLFITLYAPGPKRWLLDGLAQNRAARHRGMEPSTRSPLRRARHGRHRQRDRRGHYQLLKRRSHSAVDALDAALPGRPAVPNDMTAALRKLDKSEG